MSASSLLVMWGIITQLRCRLAPLIFLMRERSLRSVGPNFVKSTLGQGSTSRPDPPPVAAAGALAATARVCTAPVITALVKFCTSSWVIRPLGPLPVTSSSGTPSMRANLRTEGLACGRPADGVPGWCAGTGAVAVVAGAAAVAGGAAAGAEGATTGAADVELVADLDLELLQHASGGRRDFHRGLVGFDREQRLLGLHRVAGLDQQLDHGHVLEVADVGHAHFEHAARRGRSHRCGRCGGRFRFDSC